MTVLDTSAAIDYLLADGVAAQVQALLSDAGPAAAPDLAVELFPSLPLRERAFELRQNLTAADALFVALAEQLGEWLVTKDRALARAAEAHTGIDVLLLE